MQDLPARLRELVQAFIDEQRVHVWYAKAPALSASETGRNILALAPADRACVAVAAYGAWSSEGARRVQLLELLAQRRGGEHLEASRRDARF
jgi:hypothetical protein